MIKINKGIEPVELTKYKQQPKHRCTRGTNKIK